MVVLYNVGEDVRGAETKIATLIERADYAALKRIATPTAAPIELVQAEYSLAIAGAAGAKEFVPNQYSAAEAEAAGGPDGVGVQEKRRSQQRARHRARGRDPRRGRAPRRARRTRRRRRESATRGRGSSRRGGGTRARRAGRRRTAARDRSRPSREPLASPRKKPMRSARAEARAQLLNRLNAVLPTRDSERGLVSEIGGVQFATATANLNPPARESLARFSGIVASYPELRFTIEGHTDNVGSDADEQRALVAARDQRPRLPDVARSCRPRASTCRATARRGRSPTTPRPMAARATAASRS